MSNEIKITEIKNFDLKGGYVVDGFPHEGNAASIAAESMVRTSNFELAGYIDSELFPPISIIKEGVPNYPVSIFVNEKLKVAVFLSHLKVSESFSRDIATIILQYAKKHHCKQIISSMKIAGVSKNEKKAIAVCSTDKVKNTIKKLGMNFALNATIPGIPGMLLVQGRFSNQDVIVLLFSDNINKSTDLEYGAKLCLSISALIPNLSCNLKLISNEAIKAQKMIKKAQKDSKHIHSNMYR